MPGASSVAGRWLGLLGIGLMLIGTAGCGGKKLYPAQGRVVFDDDTPLTGGWVTFEPLDADVKVGARGDIQSDGMFQLGTYRDGDGALEGRYRAVVMPPRGGGRSEKNPEPPVVDFSYQSFATSPLEFRVTSDPHENHFTLTIKRHERRNPQPR